MPRRFRHLLALGLTALTLACGDKDEDDEEEDESSGVADAYVTALCRLYSEPACVEAQEEECGFSFSFESQSDCEQLFGYSLSACPEAETALDGIADQVTACVAALDAVECGTDPLCASDTGGSADGAFENADCLAVEAATEGLCDDSGR